jgi:hypothetical protein
MRQDETVHAMTRHLTEEAARQVIEALRSTAQMLNSARLIMSDAEARATAGEQVRRSGAALALLEAAPKVQEWSPQFDAISLKQEQLVRKFCFEIAGPRGKKGSPPDPVRLLEMAQALYEAEREEMKEPTP